MDGQLEQQVRERAFQLWQGGAVKGGSDIDYWVAAESEVRAKLMTAPADAAPAKPKRARSTKASTPKVTTAKART